MWAVPAPGEQHYIHCDLTNVEIIQGKCDKSFCWHQTGSKTGKECYYKGIDKYIQCTKSDSDIVINTINSLLIKQENAYSKV